MRRVLVVLTIVLMLSVMLVASIGASNGLDPVAQDKRGTYCVLGYPIPFVAGSLVNNSSETMRIKGELWRGIGQGYQEGTINLLAGQDSRDTAMCDVDHINYPGGDWVFWSARGPNDWAKISVFRITCNDAPSFLPDYDVTCP